MRHFALWAAVNTPAHLLIGVAAFGRMGGRKTLIAAMFGGLLPDLSLYLLAGTSLFLLNIPPQVVFDELYFSDAWQSVFAIDNSIPLWAVLLFLSIRWGRLWMQALCAAALLHLGLDFALHHDDGRPHFWPLSNWVFESPVSYWDIRRGGAWIGPIEVMACLVATLQILLVRPGWVLGGFTLALLAIEIRVVIGWFNFVA